MLILHEIAPIRIDHCSSIFCRCKLCSIINSQNDGLDISLDYYGNRENEMLEYLLDAFNKKY